MRAALDELPDRGRRAAAVVAAHRAGTDPTELAADYVELFDFRRRCCLHLTYYTAGDTRNRGEALVVFAAAYKAAGLRGRRRRAARLPAGRARPRRRPTSRAGACCASTASAWTCSPQALAASGSVYRHAVEAIRAHAAAAERRPTSPPRPRWPAPARRASRSGWNPSRSSTPPEVAGEHAAVGRAIPYLAIVVLVGGLIWRYRYDKFGWTTRSSQLYETTSCAGAARCSTSASCSSSSDTSAACSCRSRGPRRSGSPSTPTT